MGEVASSNLVVPTIYFQSLTGGKCPKWVRGFEPGFLDLGCRFIGPEARCLIQRGDRDLELLVASIALHDRARARATRRYLVNERPRSQQI